MGKAVAISISLILVVGVIVAAVATVKYTDVGKASKNEGGPAPPSGGGISTGMKAVETLCAPTEYKDACISTLAPVANKNGSAGPKDFVEALFDAAMVGVKKGLEKSGALGKDFKDGYDKGSLEACEEMLDLAVDDLKNAIAKITDSDLHSVKEVTSDLKNWLSAVSAFKSDCIEFIDNPELKQAMSDALGNTTELTHNALGMIDSIADIFSKMNINIPFLKPEQQKSRRLLSNDGYPSWFPAAERKLMAANVLPKPNVVVAKDGSGNFKTINEAVASYPKNHQGRYIIHVKAGIYKEKVEIPKNSVNIFMYGDGSRKTVVTGDLNYAIKQVNTYNTATFAVNAQGFLCKGMGFENTAGPAGHQAVALRVSADMAAFFECAMDGYQDTLYYQTKRQLYSKCEITGTIDFIFGHGRTVIQDSLITVRMGEPTSYNAVTADGTEYEKEDSGLVLQNCRIVADPKLAAHTPKIKTYLGRPWKKDANVLFIDNDIGDLIDPEGFTPWQNYNNVTKKSYPVHFDTCKYFECGNRGPGANLNGRIKWKTLHAVTDRKQVARYAVRSFLLTGDGGDWLTPAGEPFRDGF